MVFTQFFFLLLLLPLPFTHIAIAGDDTVRVDPLNHLNKYRAGFRITNIHYWSSTIFTGIYGYAIGVLWVLGGMIYGCFLLSTTKTKITRKGKPRERAPCPIILATLFTILAIAASGLVLGGNARLDSRARTVVDIIVDTANHASQTLYNTTGAMREMESSFRISNATTTEASTFLTSTSHKLDAEAAHLQRQATKNRHLIHKGLTLVYAITTVTVSLNLIALIALSVSGVLRLKRPLYLLITLCWFLTFLCWVLFGLYFFLDKFSSDTCTALESFQQNPYNNSLSSILPCDELYSAESVLFDVSSGIYNIVNKVNANISLMQSTSFPSIPYVCNPFSGPPQYQYLTGYCPDNTVRIGDVAKVLKIFTCSDADNGACKDGEFISNNEYKTVEAYTNSIQNLLNVYPGMESLVECKAVKDAFSEILVKHCRPLKRYVHMVWAALVSLSLIMVVLVLIWTHHVYEQHHFFDGSVKPHSNAQQLN